MAKFCWIAHRPVTSLGHHWGWRVFCGGQFFKTACNSLNYIQRVLQADFAPPASPLVMGMHHRSGSCLKPYIIKSGLSEPQSGVPYYYVFVHKRSSTFHALVAADIYLISLLVRVTSCALSARFPCGEKFVVSGYNRPAL